MSDQEIIGPVGRAGPDGLPAGVAPSRIRYLWCMSLGICGSPPVIGFDFYAIAQPGARSRRCPAVPGRCPRRGNRRSACRRRRQRAEPRRRRRHARAEPASTGAACSRIAEAEVVDGQVEAGAAPPDRNSSAGRQFARDSVDPAPETSPRCQEAYSWTVSAKKTASRERKSCPKAPPKVRSLFRVACRVKSQSHWHILGIRH